MAGDANVREAARLLRPFPRTILMDWVLLFGTMVGLYYLGRFVGMERDRAIDTAAFGAVAGALMGTRQQLRAAAARLASEGKGDE